MAGDAAIADLIRPTPRLAPRSISARIRSISWSPRRRPPARAARRRIGLPRARHGRRRARLPRSGGPRRAGRDARPLRGDGRAPRRDRRHVPRHRADPARRRCRPRSSTRSSPRPARRSTSCTHEEEAYLTIIGVTEGHAGHPGDARRRRRRRQLRVLRRRSERDRPRAVGLRLGSARLTDALRHARSADRRPRSQRCARAPRRDRRAHPTRTRPRSSRSAAPRRTWSRCCPRAMLDRILTRERIAEALGDPRRRAGGDRRRAAPGQPDPGPDPAGRGRDHGRDPRALRRRPHPGLRGRHPRGRDPRRRSRRPGLARPAGRSRPRLAH